MDSRTKSHAGATESLSADCWIETFKCFISCVLLIQELKLNWSVVECSSVAALILKLRFL